MSMNGYLLPPSLQNVNHYIPYQNNGGQNVIGKQYGKKGIKLQYDPENNKRNIYLRKLNRVSAFAEKQFQRPGIPGGAVPPSLFSDNPLTQLMQPDSSLMKGSKRFKIDKLDISDMGSKVKPDVYGALRNIEGREDYLNTDSIKGAKPSPLKQNHQRDGPDYKLYSKDINPDKWHTKRLVNPLLPEYEVSTKSGRMMRIGPIERSTPQPQISVATRRIANFVADIDGSHPRKTQAISEFQREQVMSNNSNLPFKQSVVQNTRNRQSIFEHQTAPPKQSDLLQETANFNRLPPPASHYARFQNHKNQSVNQLNPPHAPIQSAYEITLAGKQNLGIDSSLPTFDQPIQKAYHSRSPQKLDPINETGGDHLKSRPLLLSNLNQEGISREVGSRSFLINKTVETNPVSRRFTHIQSMSKPELSIVNNFTNVPTQAQTNAGSYQSTQNVQIGDQRVHLAQIQNQQSRNITSKREEVWSTARKFEGEFKAPELNLKISDINPRRMTDVMQSQYQKYYALNNSVIDRKPIAYVNPINHEITYNR